MDEHECQHDQGAATPHELDERAEVCDHRRDHARRRRSGPTALRLAHHHADQHRRQRKERAGGIGQGPPVAGGDHQGQGTGGHAADAPAVLRHPGSDPELLRLQQLDAVGIDHDVEGRPEDADEDGGGSHHREGRPGVEAAQEDDGGHHQHAHQPEPRAPLAEAAEDRQAHGVHQRRPQPFEVVGQEREGERRNRAFPDPVLGEPRGERRGDHGEREP